MGDEYGFVGGLLANVKEAVDSVGYGHERNIAVARHDEYHPRQEGSNYFDRPIEICKRQFGETQHVGL
jgi:hypothetical protein